MAQNPTHQPTKPPTTTLSNLVSGYYRRVRRSTKRKLGDKKMKLRIILKIDDEEYHLNAAKNFSVEIKEVKQ